MRGRKFSVQYYFPSVIPSLLPLFRPAKCIPFNGYVECSPIPRAIYSTRQLSGITPGHSCCRGNPLYQLNMYTYKILFSLFNSMCSPRHESVHHYSLDNVYISKRLPLKNNTTRNNTPMDYVLCFIVSCLFCFHLDSNPSRPGQVSL